MSYNQLKGGLYIIEGYCFIHGWLTDNLRLVASLLLLAASIFLKCIVLAARRAVANVLDDEHLV